MTNEMINRIKAVLEMDLDTLVDPKDSYIISYPHILKYFQGIDKFSVEDLVCGAHMIYGWMPTILHLHPNEVSLEGGVVILKKVKESGYIPGKYNDLEKLAKLVNHSLVGASKLLHFVAPEKFAIWDSLIYTYVFNEPASYNKLKKIDKYQKYIHGLEETKKETGFEAFRRGVCAKIGDNNTEISAFRAIELIMFLYARKNKHLLPFSVTPLTL